MMNAALIAELLRGALAGLAIVREFRKTASNEELTKFVAAIHAAGGTVDLATVDQVLDGVEAGQAALEAQIAAAGG